MAARELFLGSCTENVRGRRTNLYICIKRRKCKRHSSHENFLQKALKNSEFIDSTVAESKRVGEIEKDSDIYPQ